MKSQNGFTLVELAIALMVIGLLIGGVLKGQELIENAKITATIRQIKAYDAAAMIFRNTYGALPGDIKRPNRIPNCTNDNDMICGTAGNGNGKILESDTDPMQIELYNFFPHLTKAGMIQGPEGGTLDQMSNIGYQHSDHNADNESYFIPEFPIPSSYGIIPIYRNRHVSGERILESGHYLYFASLSAKYLDALDSKMDDGKANSGMVTFEDPVCTIDGDYSVWNREESCDAYIGLGF